ncbi:YqaE/Pmp3 family membrane protein [Nibribacter ruber]|nr:YqaE/Pmp3 family membrane protein [Nibribacter ruber]
MNIKKLLHFVWILVVGQMLFSCSSAEYYKFAPMKGDAYSKAATKPAPEAPAPEQVAATPAPEVQAEPVLEASAAAPTPVLLEKKHFAKPAVSAPAQTGATVKAEELSKAEAVALVKDRVASMTKVEKANLEKEVKTALRAGQATNIIEIIFAILIPPLGVFLHEGELNTRFWVSVLLTLLFVIPGIIYALLVVTDSI